MPTSKIKFPDSAGHQVTLQPGLGVSKLLRTIVTRILTEGKLEFYIYIKYIIYIYIIYIIYIYIYEMNAVCCTSQSRSIMVL